MSMDMDFKWKWTGKYARVVFLREKKTISRKIIIIESSTNFFYPLIFDGVNMQYLGLDPRI